MESATETAAIVRELEIDASPETVWELLVDPDKATLWMGLVAELDPVPGGVYRVQIVPGHVARGTFVELERPRRLVFTWGWEPNSDGTPASVPPGASTVEFELEPDGEGTRVRFEHRDLPTPESTARHSHGWDHYLERLVTAASGDDPGRDPWLDDNETNTEGSNA